MSETSLGEIPSRCSEFLVQEASRGESMQNIVVDLLTRPQLIGSDVSLYVGAKRPSFHVQQNSVRHYFPIKRATSF
jgi:hypothetical protein